MTQFSYCIHNAQFFCGLIYAEELYIPYLSSGENTSFRSPSSSFFLFWLTHGDSLGYSLLLKLNGHGCHDDQAYLNIICVQIIEIKTTLSSHCICKFFNIHDCGCVPSSPVLAQVIKLDFLFSDPTLSFIALSIWDHAPIQIPRGLFIYFHYSHTWRPCTVTRVAACVKAPRQVWIRGLWLPFEMEGFGSLEGQKPYYWLVL